MGFRDDGLTTAKPRWAEMATTAKSRIHRMLPLLVAVATLGAVAIAAGRWIGRDVAEQTRERLELWWPDLMTLPEGANLDAFQNF